MTERPEPRPWRDIYNPSDNGIFVTDHYLSLGPLRSYDGQLYHEVEDGRWLEFEHYIHRAAQGELPGLDETLGIAESLK